MVAPTVERRFITVGACIARPRNAIKKRWEAKRLPYDRVTIQTVGEGFPLPRNASCPVSSSREHVRCLCRSFATLKDDGKGTMATYATEGSRQADDIRAYDVYVIMVGDGVPAPLCGVLPMVALTPKGVRYPGLSAK